MCHTCYLSTAADEICVSKCCDAFKLNPSLQYAVQILLWTLKGHQLLTWWSSGTA
jgi:hypothetical protein